MKNKQALIIGNFSGANFGDILVLKSLQQYLESKNIKLKVPSSNPKNISKFFENISFYSIKTLESFSFRFFGIKTLINSVKSDYIITTAGIFFDKKLFHFKYSFILTLLPLLIFSRLFGKAKVIAIAVGISEPTTFLGRKWLILTLYLHHRIIVRDHNSKSIIKKLLGIDVEIIPDLAHTLKHNTNINEKTNDTIAINLSSFYSDLSLKELKLFFNSIKDFVIHAEKNNLKVIFFNTVNDDDTFFKENLIFYQFKNKCVNLIDNDSLEDFYSNIDYVMASRMHAVILSTIFSIPTIGFIYNDKVKSYMNETSMLEFCLNPKDIIHDKTLLFQAFENLQSQRVLISNKLDQYLNKQKSVISQKLNHIL